MKIKIVIVLLLIMMAIPFASTRSFSEMEQRYIVLGAAVDYDFEKNMYFVTIEIVNVEESSAGAVTSKSYTSNGKTMFDAVRNIIKISGKKLFWAHTKVIIISKELAANGVYPILDWVTRDQEVRDDMLIVISCERTAREIIECKTSKTSIPSNLISDMVKSYKSLPKYPKIDLWEFNHDLSTSGIEPITPTIKVIEAEGDKKLQIGGTAVFLSDTMIGTLEDPESTDLLTVRNQLAGGLIYLEKNITNLGTDVVLEIFNCTTKIKPNVEDENMIAEITVKLKLGLAEAESYLDLTDENTVKLLDKSCSDYLERHIAKTIKTVQEKYKSDIFGFGNKINISYPSYWREVKQDWNNTFSEFEFSVKVDPEISGSGIVSKSLKKE